MEIISRAFRNIALYDCPQNINRKNNTNRIRSYYQQTTIEEKKHPSDRLRHLKISKNIQLNFGPEQILAKTSVLVTKLLACQIATTYLKGLV